MRREWVYFDVETIEAEFLALPDRVEAKLLALIEHYRTAGLGNPSPAMIDDYGDGLYRLRHIKPAYQGARLIFFAVERMAGFERLVVLTVYKKESQNLPQSVLDRARTRMREYKRRRNEMDDVDRHIAKRCAESPEFKAAYEAESALLALVRARQSANLTQKDVAETLHVSQPYIAQIENGTRKPGYLLLFRYANAVGASIQITLQQRPAPNPTA